MIVDLTPTASLSRDGIVLGLARPIFAMQTGPGLPPAPGPPGGPGAKLVSPARITDLTRIA